MESNFLIIPKSNRRIKGQGKLKLFRFCITDEIKNI